MRLISAAETNFILAEAAFRGWISGTPAEYYADGVRQSLTAWGVGSKFDDYIAKAPYDGLESIIERNGFHIGPRHTKLGSIGEEPDCRY